jgi:hypothetical protein
MKEVLYERTDSNGEVFSGHTAVPPINYTAIKS